MQNRKLMKTVSITISYSIDNINKNGKILQWQSKQRRLKLLISEIKEGTLSNLQNLQYIYKHTHKVIVSTVIVDQVNNLHWQISPTHKLPKWTHEELERKTWLITKRVVQNLSTNDRPIRLQYLPNSTKCIYFSKTLLNNKKGRIFLTFFIRPLYPWYLHHTKANFVMNTEITTLKEILAKSESSNA
jgi:hypothetical protein